ncbi:MAG TPA: WG repeat-containing protein [Pyrinomonadaceae bacterium]|nr:WG repeat-containing protein [Pyrinomonadaceae bacterium]
MKHSTLRLALSLAALCAVAAAPASAQTYFTGPPWGVRNLFPVQIGTKWGYVNRSGKLVIEAKYDGAGEFAEGLAFAGRCLVNEGPDKVKPRGDRVAAPNGPGGCKWEIIDESGSVVAKLKKSPYINAFFSEGLALFRGRRGLYGYMDKSGKRVIKPRFENASPFREGLAAVCLDALRCGLIDRAGKYVVRPVYMGTRPPSDGLAMVVTREGLIGYVDVSGELVIAPQFVGRCASDFSEGLAPAAYPDTECGFIDKLGHFVIAQQFEYAGEFSDGLAPVRVGGKVGYVDHEGMLVIEPQFCEVHGFAEGLAVAATCGYGPGDTEETTYYETFRRGFIDKTGKFVLEPQRIGPERFRGGLALVHTADGVGYIDREGNFVWKQTRP